MRSPVAVTHPYEGDRPDVRELVPPDAKRALLIAGRRPTAPDRTSGVEVGTTSRPDTTAGRARDAPRVSIVLPAYDEELNVEKAIAEATETAERLFAEHEVIVVDDGSNDRTAELVARAAERDSRVHLVQHERNRGYGEAIRSGFLACKLDFVLLTDADLQFDLDEVERFLPYVGTVDVVAGYRMNRKDRLPRRLMGYAWNLLMRILFYVPVRDIDCAFKLFDRRVLVALEIGSVGAMVSTELMVKLGRAGASVVEVGVTHRPRRAGQARGASPRVIGTALVELWRMRGSLSSLEGRLH